MTDLLRGGNPLSPGNPSYCAAASRTLDVSRSALDAAKSIVLNVARNSLAVVLSRPLGAAVMITALSISTFCAVGYVHYKRSASDERFAAHRAERANVNLQDALGRLRDELAATKPRIDTPDDSGTGQTPASERDNTDRVAQFTGGLEQPRNLADPQRPTWAVRLSWEPRSFNNLEQSQVRLQQLSAERDQLRARVSELEQKLSFLQTQRGPRPAAKAATLRTATPGQAPAAAAAGASASPPTADVQAPEHPRQLAVIFPDKNFTPPGWVPTNFSNESSPIRGNLPHRSAETQR